MPVVTDFPQAQEQPLVSVVLPVYNRAAVVSTAIRSVLGQTYPNLELIVVDDGSGDDLAATLSGFTDKRLKLVRLHQNSGVGAARNAGICAATGELLAFQDSDDEWVLDKLERQVELMAQHTPDAICFGTVIRRFNDRVRVIPPMIQVHGAGFVRSQSLLPVAYVQAWLLPTQAVRDVGGFDEGLPVWEDWDLLLRLQQKLTWCIAPEARVLSSRLADSLTVNEELFLHAMQLLRVKHAALFQQHRWLGARWDYLHARRLLARGHTRLGLRMLVSAFLKHPGYWRAPAYMVLFVASLLGRRLFPPPKSVPQAGPASSNRGDS